MSPESPIVVTHQMSSIIIQIDLPLSGGIKISPARRIEGWEGHGKDPLSSSRVIEGGSTESTVLAGQVAKEYAQRYLPGAGQLLC